MNVYSAEYSDETYEEIRERGTYAEARIRNQNAVHGGENTL